VSYACIVFFTCLLFLNGFGVFFPGNWSTSSFLTSYIGFPIFIAIYFAHRIWKRKDAWIIPSSQVDLTTGLDYILALESIDLESRPKEKSNRVVSAFKRVLN
jgi:amino acid transporter